MAKWILAGFGVVMAACAALVFVAGFALWQGASLAARAASLGIEQARATLERAAPPEVREQARARLDSTVEALRSGRFDPAVLSEAAWWLPGALVDGQLDANERRALWEKLDRLTPEARGEAAPVGAATLTRTALAERLR